MNTEDQTGVASVWKLGGLTRRELGRRIWLEIYEGDLFTRAAALSYYFLLAVFPLLLFLMAVLGYLAESGTELRKNLLEYLGRVVPRSGSQLIYTVIDEITKDANGGKLSFGLLAALWFASYGMGAITETLNAAYGVKESRPFWRIRLSAVGLTIMFAVLIISALALVLYGGEIGKAAANRLGSGEALRMASHILQWPIVIAFLLLAFALIYYFAPDLHHRNWYWITPGSAVGAVLWLLVTFCFRIYLYYFDRYSVTYGSLGAAIILMLWFYVTGAAILIGGKVNAEIENAAARMGEPAVSSSKERNSRAETHM
jgi:membrane protein